jgi:hypothetical protein
LFIFILNAIATRTAVNYSELFPTVLLQLQPKKGKTFCSTGQKKKKSTDNLAH